MRVRDAVHGPRAFHLEPIVGSERRHMSAKRRRNPAHFDPPRWTIRRDDAAREQVS
jgi:hypothetical protein